jgi:hypothetical protein
MTRLALALVLAVTVSASQAQTSARPASYRIAGTVVSNIDHHPLQRVPVKLLKPGDYSDIQTTTSDEYGRFEFVHVPAGGFVLQGSAPGYLPTYYQEHGGFNTGIITGAGVDISSCSRTTLATAAWYPPRLPRQTTSVTSSSAACSRARTSSR